MSAVDSCGLSMEVDEHLNVASDRAPCVKLTCARKMSNKSIAWVAMRRLYLWSVVWHFVRLLPL